MSLQGIKKEHDAFQELKVRTLVCLEELSSNMGIYLKAQRGVIEGHK